MAESIVSPHALQFTGENPFLRLKRSPDGPDTTLAAFWRARHSPAGPGHALFLRSDATDGKILILSDNEGLLRWVQGIEAMLRPEFGDRSLPFLPADFAQEGDTLSVWREVATAGAAKVELAWSGFGAGFLISLEPGNDLVGDWGVSSFMLPAGAASLRVGGRPADGRAFSEEMAGAPSSTAALAFAENWYRPA